MEAMRPKLDVSIRIKHGVDQEPEEDLTETETMRFNAACIKRAPWNLSNIT